MSSPLDICNSALTKLGGRRITSLTQEVKEAKLCGERYPFLRDELLQRHMWNFAISRIQLAKLSTTPAFGFDNEFQLPSDCLKVIDIDSPDYDFVIEGRVLRTNLDEVRIKYIKKITNTALFSPVFVEALSLRLAWDLSYSLIQSGTQTDFWRQSFEQYMREARSLDAQEGTPEKVIDEYNDVFLNARF
jgi:hypothetical protein